ADLAERRDTVPGDLDHVRRDVDAGDRVAAAREQLAEPAGPAPDVEHLGPQAELEQLDDVRERAQAAHQLRVRRRSERLRPQPRPPARVELLHVPEVSALVVLPDVGEPAPLAGAAGSPKDAHAGRFYGRRA